MPTNLKKLLVVSSWAPPSIGGPQVLYNLLSQFPKDRYSILTSFYAIDELSAKKGTWLDGTYFFYDNPTMKSRDISLSEEKINKKNNTRNAVQKLKYLMKRISFIHTLFGLPVILWQIMTLVRHGKEVLAETKSEILLGISDYGPAMIGSFLLHKKTKLPLSIFLFDLYKGNSFPFPGNILARLFEKKILMTATSIIVTNEGTKKFYADRYGDEISKKITVLYNSVFPEAYNKGGAVLIEKKTPPFTIIFTGRVNWPQLGSIKNLIQAVNELPDFDITFRLYTPSPKDYLKDVGIVESKNVKLSFAPPQEMPSIQKQSDILFLPLSWNTKSPAIINTATPGKLTDYLIAGSAILVHAPAASVLVEYAKDNNFAEIVDQNDVELLKQTLQQLLRNPSRRTELVKNAQATFYKNHDTRKNAEVFKQLFTT
jgi:glycosyltransferase involved in cell wall biosynthesis